MASKKFKIAQNPTFKADVKIPRVGGAHDVIQFEYKFIPRKEMASLFDDWREQTLKGLENLTDESTFVEATDFEVEFQVTQLLGILVGWGFEDEFNEDNVRMLAEYSPHAATAIIDGFRDAYAKAKEGN